MATNQEVVQAAVEAFGRGDIPGVLDLCAENVTVVFTVAEPTAIPFAGRWSGKRGVGEYFQAIGDAFDVLKWELDHCVAGGDRVATFGSLEMRSKATGKIVDSLWALDFTVANGAITGWQVYGDSAAIERALAAT